MTHRRSDTSIGAARAYHPRGRTVRDRHRSTATLERDSLRSALKVFDDEPATPAGPRKPPAPRKPAAPRKAAPRKAATPRNAAPGKAATPRKPAAPRKAASPRATPRKVAAPRKPARPPRPPKLANPRRRLRLATVLVLTMFAVLGLRLVELQLTDGPAYAATGLENRLIDVVLPAERGAIFDRSGAVLAHSVEARYVYADPELVTDPERVAAALQPLLGIPASDLVELMRPSTRPDGTPSRFEWLARGVDIAVAEQIEALNLPGIGIDWDERRIVPGNDLAANLIGFTGSDQTGLAGLEAQFDEVLRGVDGWREFESGQGEHLAGHQIPGGQVVETPPQPGSDLRLTIDMDLQYEVQQVLADQLRARSATFGAAVVLDVHSGEVLAQASYPTYNAADPFSAPESAWIDAASATVFDPGSVHKPLVLGAALEEGVIAPGDSVVIDPTIVKGDTTFRDVIWHPPGTRLGLPAVLAFSSNVGTIKIADMLGKEKLYEYQRAFGLGEAAGIGLPGEAAGALLPPDEWYESSYGSVPIGHSVTVTTLQLAAAYAAIANDGVWVQPQLVQAVIGPDGSPQPAADPATRRVLSVDTAAYLREIMEAVTTVSGATGLNAAVEDYRVAGKTGTGEVVVEGEYTNGEVASFVGMAPADQPRYVIAVVAHTPGGGGGEVAGPAFREMMAFTLNRYRVPPATTEPPAFDLYPGRAG